MRLSHITWNLAGLSLPLLVAAAVVPKLISNIGNERFGLLALAWGLIGYAGALDLGIGRALTQMVARMKGEATQHQVPDALATAGRITMTTGLIGAILIAAAALLGASNLIKAERIAPAELINSMLLLALALPAQAMSATYRGINEAYLNFKGISILRVALGVVNFGGPFVISLYTHNLACLVATLVASRLMALFVYRSMAVSCLVGESHVGERKYSPELAKKLFSFGGWVAISSVVSPIMLLADRFAIASIISASAVAIYVVPYELVVQSLILVGAISSVMFPTLTTLIRRSPNEWKRYFHRWLGIIILVMGVSCATLAIFLPNILQIWLKGAYDPQSISVGRFLCIGVFFNSIGAMYCALLHAFGRADLTAKMHLIELPIFIVALSVLLSTLGLKGAAIAWTARTTIDAIALAVCARLNHA